MSDLRWSPQQEHALSLGKKWLDAPLGTVPQVMRIEGWAGTGKTSIAKALYDHIGGRALAAAFTGKAASVLSKKGLPAATLHRLIYDYVGTMGAEHLGALKEEARILHLVRSPTAAQTSRLEALQRQITEAEVQARQPKFMLKEYSDISSTGLVIIDEHSMLDERMGQDLLSFGTKILALGDPGQLPPIAGTGFFCKGPPDVMITEVHRTANDSPILRLATLAREGKALPLGDFGDARVTSKISAKEALAADQIITGTNAQRRAINARHRELYGHTALMPEKGERLVAMRNDHELGILNGSGWRVVEADSQWVPGEDTAYLRIQPEDGGAAMGISCVAQLFLDDGTPVDWRAGQQFTFSYALTCHRAQGSEWDNVVVMDNWPRRDSHASWLYTAITRACSTLHVVKL